jgi:Cu2+-exporting ATPase
LAISGERSPAEHSVEVARAVATQLRLDEYFAEVLPQQKEEKVREIKAVAYPPAMICDSVNDAPALTESDLGIAIGAGADVAIVSADVVLIPSNPRDVLTNIEAPQLE